MKTDAIFVNNNGFRVQVGYFRCFSVGQAYIAHPLKTTSLTLLRKAKQPSLKTGQLLSFKKNVTGYGGVRPPLTHE